MLETERLVLRKPRLDDAHDLLEYVGDAEVMRWIGGEIGDLAATVATIERWLGRWDESGIGMFSVAHDGVVVGRVGFLIWDADGWGISSYARAAEPVTELGWAIARRYWGNGYATEAASALRSWGYERGIESLVSLINPANVRSIRVAEKLDAVPTDTVEIAGRPAVIWRHPQQLS